MKSERFINLTTTELDSEIAKMRKRIKELNSDIKILESLKLANELREKKKSENNENRFHKIQESAKKGF